MAKARRGEVIKQDAILTKQNLRKGESYLEDRDLYYCYYYDETGKRKRLTSKTLEGLREAKLNVENLKAKQIKISEKDRTLDSVYKEWLSLKTDLAEHTIKNYTWIYEHYCLNTKLGKMKIVDITQGKIMEHYNKLRDLKNLSVTTIDGLQTVVGQVFRFAVNERYITYNPASGAMYSMKRKVERGQAHPALKEDELKRLLSFTKNHNVYKKWYPVIYTFSMTGVRVGELIGLRWKDIDFEKNTISINHAISYFTYEGETKYVCGRPKTKAGNREIYMLGHLREVLLQLKKHNEENGVVCKITIKGTEDAYEDYYTDFIFINQYGSCHNHISLNHALKRIIREANCEAMDNYGIPFLPKFSCHNFRSTFITNCAIAKVPIVVTKKMVGHEDGRVTEQIYTTVHPEWQREELKAFEDKYDFFEF